MNLNAKSPLSCVVGAQVDGLVCTGIDGCGPVVVVMLLDVAHYTRQAKCEYKLNNNIKTRMNGTCPQVSLWGIVYWSRLRKTHKSINNDDTRETLVFNIKCLIGDRIFKQVLISK